MKEHKKTGFFLALSLFLHISLVLLLPVWKSDREKSKKPLMEVEWVELIPIQTDNRERIQIVDQEKKTNGKVPEKNYRLSQSHQDILRETKAKKRGAFRNVKNRQEEALEPKRIRVEKRGRISLDDLKPGFFGPKAIMGKPSPQTGRTNNFEVPPLNPSRPLKAQSSTSGIEISQTDDYLKRLALGDRTLLKTREFVYYSYYSRIKKKLGQSWKPRLKIKIMGVLGKGRKIASMNDRITRLVITLNRSGELTGVQVKSSSGLNELDDAAIEAFWEASPFPNPPTGLVNELGEVKINWDFVLES